MQKDFVLILGPQSSGKSTQAQQLAEHLGYRFISSGKLLRRLGEGDNPIGQKLREYWSKGELVPDSLMEELLFPILEKETMPGFVIDGYPRNISQLQSFLAFLDMKGWAISHVFYLAVSEEECLRRVKLRAERENRLDDADEETVRRRMLVYHNATEPLLFEYSKLNVLQRIDGERSIEEIQKDLQSRFQK